MKKVFIVLMVIVCLVMTGCGKEKEKGQEPMVGGWKTVFTDRVNDILTDDMNVFNNAVKTYDKESLEVYAVLGKQVVSGTNYMFLAKSDNKYKIVIIYSDLEGVSKVSKVVDFDYTKYTSKSLDGSASELAGVWYTTKLYDTYVLENEKIQNAFVGATSELDGMNYQPLAVVGEQLVSGTNYAILCYGNAVVPDAKTGIYLLTIYSSLDGKNELTSSYYLDLASFN